MTVAVAYSRSKEGVAALRAAVDLAARLGEDLAVLSVVPDDPDGEVGAEVQGLREAVTRDLEAVAHTLHATPDWRLRTCAAGHDVPRALLELLADTDAGMLVVGSRRRRPVGKFVMGSVVQRLILDSPVPVLSVKPDK